MTSGLATDDPWADRHLDLTDDEFDAIVSHGLLFAVPTGTIHEYSNFGYAVLGRVVAAGQRAAHPGRRQRGTAAGDSAWTRRRGANRCTATGLRRSTGATASRRRAATARRRPDRTDGRDLDDGRRPGALGDVARRRLPGTRRPGRRSLCRAPRAARCRPSSATSDTGRVRGVRCRAATATACG